METVLRIEIEYKLVGGRGLRTQQRSETRTGEVKHTELVNAPASALGQIEFCCLYTWPSLIASLMWGALAYSALLLLIEVLHMNWLPSVSQHGVTNEDVARVRCSRHTSPAVS